MTREEAIEILENEKACVNRANKNDYCNRDCYNCELVKTDTEILNAIDMAIQAIEQTKWIPCSERMPEEHEWMGTKRFGTTISDEVYVTFESSKGERFCEHLSFQNGKLSSRDQSIIEAFYKSSKPIAWMPLPEPYQPKDSERNNKNANT